MNSIRFHCVTLVILFLWTVVQCKNECVLCNEGNDISRWKAAPSLSVNWNGNSFQLVLLSDNGKQLNGELGLVIPSDLGSPTQCDEFGLCWRWGNLSSLSLIPSLDGQCYSLQWTSQFQHLKDCYSLSSAHWYGGAENKVQNWPVEQESHREAPYVTADFFQDGNAGVMEPYWLNSDGFAIHVERDIPLFTSWNEDGNGQLCLVTRYRSPYPVANDVLPLKYTICSGSDLKDMHVKAISQFWNKPKGIPDTRVLTHPIWSTWARYKGGINQTKVLEFAAEIRSNGFNDSQLEIDDDWETCYGELEFTPVKFPDPQTMVNQLKAQGFRTTLWIHPFINLNCPSFTTAANYLVHDAKGLPALTSWWRGTMSGIADFTKAKSRDWWSARVRKLQTDIGIDSFKFDAGETNWLPAGFSFNEVPLELQPNIYSQSYVNNMETFGGMIEVRVGWNSQEAPVLVRMLDKDSVWSYDNGLKTLIPTLLQFNLEGYFFVLPDMIGGNGYLLPPGKELYVRWMQANVFMPTMQFSYVPWDYDQETVDIALKMTALHAKYAPTIISLAEQSVVTGLPINRPLWWIDPLDPVAQTIDSEYLLGDDVLVAPVLENNAVSRDIYLPIGQWRDEVDPNHPIFNGPQWLTSYPAALDVLPYFTRVNT